MKIEVTQEWCLDMAEREGDYAIGAGAPANNLFESPTLSFRWLIDIYHGKALQQEWVITSYIDDPSSPTKIEKEWRDIPIVLEKSEPFKK